MCKEVLSDVPFGALRNGTKCLMNRYENEDPLQCLPVGIELSVFRVGNTVVCIYWHLMVLLLLEHCHRLIIQINNCLKFNRTVTNLHIAFQFG